MGASPTSVCLYSLLVLAMVAPYFLGVYSEPLCGKCHCVNTTLNCSSQLLQELPSDPSSWPADVEEAYFDNNKLVHIKQLPSLPRLRILNLEHNLIQKIDPAAFQNLTALQVINLNSNELTRFSLKASVFKGQYDQNDFLPLGNMSALYLDSNSIHSVDSDVFENIPHLKILSLAYNPIRRIDVPTTSAITSLAHLEELDLSYTDIEKLPPTLLHSLLHLHKLNISGNFFTAVPEELAELHELKELRLNSNPIRYLEAGSFAGDLSTLEVLEMNWMHNLSRVGPGAFHPLSNLHTLHLAHSLSLKEIDKDAFREKHPSGNMSYPPIKEIVLRGNSLQRLDAEVLNWWGRKMELIDLQDNLWMCDCDLQWMVEVLEPMISETHPELLSHVICENPEPMRGHSIFSLHARDYHLRCADMYDARPDHDAYILIGALIGTLLAVPATLACILCWKRGGFAWLSTGYGGAASYSRAFYRRTNNVEDF